VLHVALGCTSVALRRAAGSPLIREIDLADVLVDVSDILEFPQLDVFLFGSRRFKTGSVRSRNRPKLRCTRR
jgi:hypothetical protein